MSGRGKGGKGLSGHGKRKKIKTSYVWRDEEECVSIAHVNMHDCCDPYTVQARVPKAHLHPLLKVWLATRLREPNTTTLPLLELNSNDDDHSGFAQYVSKKEVKTVKKEEKEAKKATKTCDSGEDEDSEDEEDEDDSEDSEDDGDEHEYEDPGETLFDPVVAWTEDKLPNWASAPPKDRIKIVANIMVLQLP